MNYKLTTDLIADCMALIPQNLELLNEKTNGLYFTANEGTLLFYNVGTLAKKVVFSKLSTQEKFAFFAYCLRTIPKFQVNTNKYLELEKESSTSGSGLERAFATIVLSNTRKTIASATLHGQGEFPPSTLEELCESYKNVMNK